MLAIRAKLSRRLIRLSCLPFPPLKTEKYFDMKKTQCKEGLDIYKKFLTRMTRISEFLKVAEVAPERTSALAAASFRLPLIKQLEKITRVTSLCLFLLFKPEQQVGIDRGDIPDLSQVSRTLQCNARSAPVEMKTCPVCP